MLIAQKVTPSINVFALKRLIAFYSIAPLNNFLLPIQVNNNLLRLNKTAKIHLFMTLNHWFKMKHGTLSTFCKYDEMAIKRLA
jgi:hypothetical protein